MEPFLPMMDISELVNLITNKELTLLMEVPFRKVVKFWRLVDTMESDLPLLIDLFYIKYKIYFLYINRIDLEFIKYIFLLGSLFYAENMLKISFLACFPQNYILLFF